MILSISIPILNAIYPVAIVLIILGLFDKLFKNNKHTYKLCIYSTVVISCFHALNQLIDLGFVNEVLSYIPLYDDGFGWVIVCLIVFVLSIILDKIMNKYKKNVTPL